MVFNLTTGLSLPHEDGLHPNNISQLKASITVIINTMLELSKGPSFTGHLATGGTLGAPKLYFLGCGQGNMGCLQQRWQAPSQKAKDLGGGGGQAGLKALYTCTSWYAYAAMSGNSTRSLV